MSAKYQILSILACLSLALLSCDRQPPTSAGATGLTISGQISLGGAPRSQVELSLVGDLEASATTDSLGKYVFTDLVTGVYAVRPTQSGFTFTPSDKQLQLESSSITGQDFVMVPVKPWLLVDKQSIDFGAVEVGKPRILTIGLSNLGKLALTVSSITSSNPLFAVASGALSIQKDSLVNVNVTFSPAGSSAASATITINSNDPDSPQKTVGVAGRGLTSGSARITVAPSPLTFSAVRVGSRLTLKLTLTNNGTDILHLDSVLTTHPAFSYDLPATALAFGRSLEMGVTFAPTDTGTVSAQLRISSDATNSPKTLVTLSGAGFVSLPSSIVVNPEVVDFGNVFKDSLQSRTLRISNTGKDSLVITSMRLTGGNFSSTFTGGTIIAPGSFREYAVRFLSSSLGQLTGSMTIFHSDPQRTDIVVPLSANVINIPPSKIRFNPDTLSFDSTGVGAEAVRQVWVVNANSVPLSVWNFQLPDTTFRVSADSVPVPAGDSVALTVYFKPGSAAQFSSQISMQTNVANLPTTNLQLRGAAFQTVTGKIKLSTDRLDFGTRPLSTATPLNLTVTNEETANRLAIRTVGTNNPAFIVTAKPDTIQPGLSGEITVEFRPTVAGLASATLSISSSDPARPTSQVTLTGGAVDTSASGTALLTLAATSLDIGQVVTNLTGTALLTIGNIGKDTLRISGFGFSHDEFSASPAQIAVPPRVELAVTVSFRPVATGVVSGQMIIFSNNQLRAADTVQVKGTGVSEGGQIEEREIFIQGGSFLMGYAGEVGPVRQVTLSGFYMDVFEITNEQFKEFVDAGGYNNRAFWSSEGWVWRTTVSEFGFDPQQPRPRYWAASGSAPWEADTYSNRPATPVVGVSWFEAEAFARFSGKSLPTEAQWEYAVRGSQGRIYPWGDAWIGDYSNHGQVFSPYYDMSDGYKYTASITSFPQGQTPTGLFAMAGNVMEWIADWYGPYDEGQTINPKGAPSGLERVIRGGSWAGSIDYVRGFHRNKSQPQIRYRDGGIRLVRNF